MGDYAMKAIHHRLKPHIALIAVLLLAACGNKPQPPAPQTVPPQAQAPQPQLFQQERQALDKAKGVGQTEAKGADEEKKEAENQTK
jgi:outer membrane biogenesis lipoprotein LolB